MASRLRVCLMGFVATLLRISAQTQDVQPLLEDLSGDTSYPALSHDGKTLAFVWCGPGGEKCGIYLRGFQSTESPQLLVGEDERSGIPVALAWAPDDKTLAFARFYARSEVRLSVISVSSPPGPERSFGWLCDHGHQPEFAPDGNSVVAAVPIGHPAEAQSCSPVMLSLQTGERVSTLAARGVSPSFSPNGRILAYADGQTLKTLRINDASARPVTVATEPRMIDAVGWAPDGQSIFYEVLGDVRFLRRIDLNVPAAAPETITELTASGFALSRVLSDGRLVGTVWSIDSAESSVVSRDGRMRAFLNRRSGYYEIWLREKETGLEWPLLRQIPTLPHESSLPDLIGWSPDGKWILFATAKLSRQHVYLLPFSRKEVSRAKRLGAGVETLICKAWSADSRTIYCQQSSWDVSRPERPMDWNGQLKAIDVASGKVRDLGMQGTEPISSPDGVFLYYLQRSGPSKGHLMRIRLDGKGEAEPLTKSDDYHLIAVDQQRAYLSRRSRVIEALDLETRRSTVVARIPDGSRILSFSPEQQSAEFSVPLQHSQRAVITTRSVAASKP